jgi:protein Mpv17
MAAFRGYGLPLAMQIAKSEFWGLMRAGWKLWPVVCAVNYIFVRSVQGRALVGNLAGVGWNVYLSLVASGR